eukprot:m.287875 g.287875  ORF g.287875 m.287875 type:complete len:693 (+) comp16368_c0_seq16:2144-4222(+)
MRCFPCDGGYICNNYDREPCPVDTYKPTSTSTSCSPCPLGTSTLNWTARLGIDGCRCAPGRYLLGDTCTVCPKGSSCEGHIHKDLCVNGTYQPKDGQTECLSCPLGSIGTDMIGAMSMESCQCELGRFRNITNGTLSCPKCPEGHYCDGTVSKVCPANTFSGAGMSSCSACPMNSSAAEKSTHVDFCVCNSGTFKTTENVTRGFECAVCPQGFACKQNDISLCEMGTYSPGGEAECEACPLNSTTISSGASNVNNCFCDAGFERLNDTISDGFSCAPCAFDYFKDAEHEKCVPCPAGSFTLIQAADTINLCGCDKGYFKNHSLEMSEFMCEECPAGSACDGESSYLCTNNTYSNAKMDECIACGAFELATENATLCVCQDGYYAMVPGDNCEACPVGHMCIGNTKTPCPFGQYQNETGQTACKICPPGAWHEEMGAVSEDDCIRSTTTLEPTTSTPAATGTETGNTKGTGTVTSDIITGSEMTGKQDGDSTSFITVADPETTKSSNYGIPLDVQNEEESSGSNLPIIIGAACGGVCLLLVFILIVRKRKKKVRGVENPVYGTGTTAVNKNTVLEMDGDTYESIDYSGVQETSADAMYGDPNDQYAYSDPVEPRSYEEPVLQSEQKIPENLYGGEDELYEETYETMNEKQLNTVAGEDSYDVMQHALQAAASTNGKTAPVVNLEAGDEEEISI